MIKKVDKKVNGKRRNKKNNNKKNKFDIKIFLLIVIISVIAIFTIIQSTKMAVILGSATKRIIDDFINGEETSYNYYTEMRG